MRFGATWLGVVAALGLSALGACAGSQSESPWPVEPANSEPELIGERPRQGVDVNLLPNRYGAGGGAETEDDALEDQARKREERERGRDNKRLERSKRQQGPNNDPMRPRGRSPMTP